MLFFKIVITVFTQNSLICVYKYSPSSFSSISFSFCMLAQFYVTLTASHLKLQGNEKYWFKNSYSMFFDLGHILWEFIRMFTTEIV